MVDGTMVAICYVVYALLVHLIRLLLLCFCYSHAFATPMLSPMQLRTCYRCTQDYTGEWGE